ncbi:MAG TPA: hypothetical protein VLG50_05820 [Candidatus Saccharimonadales bacterium]|nr:hypothetical protein [Candidatus Saccharimonadales bacterium]
MDEHLLIKDDSESKAEFDYRKELTLKLYHDNTNLNPMAIIVLARMMIHKKRLGVMYDNDIEVLINKLNI